MTPTEWAAQLDIAARLEALEAHHRDGLRLAQAALAAQRAAIAVAAPSTPVLREPDRPEWVWAGEIARQIKAEKGTIVARLRRALARGDTHLARKVGGRWQGRLDLMAPSRGSHPR